MTEKQLLKKAAKILLAREDVLKELIKVPAVRKAIAKALLTNPDFATLVVQVTYQTVANYVWGDALPNTTYHYRVRTQNDAGASDWSLGSFQTVAPRIQVTSPNGYEAWHRGLRYYIQWNDNVAESVVIDLYKGGVFLKTLATTSSAGAWQWEAGVDLVPGSDYSIRVRSSSDPALFAFSAAAFGIDPEKRHDAAESCWREPNLPHPFVRRPLRRAPRRAQN